MFTLDKMKILPLNTDNSLEKGVKKKWRWECLEEKDVEGERESGEKNNKTLLLFPSVNRAERQTYNGSGKAFRIHAKDASHKISDMIMKTNQVRIFLTLSSWKKVVL